MRRSVLLFLLGAFMPALLLGQLTFEELVDRAFGSDQVLVNGIQFTNQYIRIDGNPYFMDGRFRNGSLLISDHLYEPVSMRYNLYSQKIEIEHLSPRGHLNMLITVPEKIPAFYLEGYEFRRMQIGKNEPAYYMVLSSESAMCFIGWTVDAMGSGSSEERFSQPLREYWIQQGQKWVSFNDRKSYIHAFPRERKKEFKALLKQERFLFNNSTTGEVVALVGATLRLLEEGKGL
jgi:hypothetical protein